MLVLRNWTLTDLTFWRRVVDCSLKGLSHQIISIWGLFSIETRHFFFIVVTKKMLETNVQDVSFWDKNADLQELRLRQGQTLKVTDKNTCFYSVPLWFVWNLLGRGTPLYNPYSYVPPQRVGFWKRVYILLMLMWSRVWFSGKLRECMNVFVERAIYEFEVDFKKSFNWRSRLSPRGDSHIKGAGMLVVSLRVFWANHHYL